MVNRVLEVLEGVAVYGPVTLDEITARLPRTRSSVYRALKSLEADGWIRRSLNGRSYSISSKMEKLSDLQFNISDDIGELVKVLHALPGRSKLSFTLVAHVRGVEFAIIDSCIFPLPLEVKCSYQKEKLASLVSAMRNGGLLRNSPKQASLENEDSFYSLYKELQAFGYVFCEDLDTGMVPVSLSSGELVIILITGRSFLQSGLDKTRKVIDSLITSLNETNVYVFKGDDREPLTAE
jgi:DNA-binding transcriptional ArsR family regulator